MRLMPRQPRIPFLGQSVSIREFITKSDHDAIGRLERYVDYKRVYFNVLRAMPDGLGLGGKDTYYFVFVSGVL